MERRDCSGLGRKLMDQVRDSIRIKHYKFDPVASSCYLEQSNLSPIRGGLAGKGRQQTSPAAALPQ